jgi:CRISPR/Cas system-associated exonuclease Cas4 (RecB family)
MPLQGGLAGRQIIAEPSISRGKQRSGALKKCGKCRLAGRPGRIIAGGIPEEWKSARRVYDSHRAQMGTDFILLEEENGVRPPHGFIVTGDGTRHRIENTDELRAWGLGVSDQIRAARTVLERGIPVRQPPAKCRTCGTWEHCGQRCG